MVAGDEEVAGGDGNEKHLGTPFGYAQDKSALLFQFQLCDGFDVDFVWAVG